MDSKGLRVLVALILAVFSSLSMSVVGSPVLIQPVCMREWTTAGATGRTCLRCCRFSPSRERCAGCCPASLLWSPSCCARCCHWGPFCLVPPRGRLCYRCWPF